MKKILIILLCLPLLSFTQSKIKTSNYFDNLTAQERNIIVMKGTEKSGSGLYNKHFEKGIYICKACNNPLFTSNSKFESNCGWPSFDNEIKEAIIRYPDNSLGMERVEICCSNCNGHLGHVFEGEKLTEKNIRHCVNSLSIKFVKNKEHYN
jgi:peptide-methionine (R)-S-oxide reductase